VRLPKLHVSQWLATISGALLVGGLVCIVLYASATAGSHLRYIGVGLLTALAAFVGGCLFGFLFGIPRLVSSGELRHLREDRRILTETVTDTTKTRTVTLPPQALTGDRIDEGVVPPAGGETPPTTGAPDVSTPPVAAPGSAPEPSQAPPAFEPSSNLAEVSDWLTKLLLGAGLVSLTKLGEPLGSLVTSVAAGLEPPSDDVSGSARTIAGAILLAYTTLGFLDGYVVTTLWYGKRLSR
jgi:hypothetical protein